jgi:hypothetical protein
MMYLFYDALRKSLAAGCILFDDEEAQYLANRTLSIIDCWATSTYFLVKSNPRPPGFQSLYATRITYGIDYLIFF